VNQADKRGQAVSEQAKDIMQGAIDFHVHTNPDVIPRRQDVFELAASAHEAGMGGFVLKGHYSQTVDRASAARNAFPDLKVYGGLVLNWPACGGLNPEAVRAMIMLGAKVIWMPTVSSVSQINFVRTHKLEHLGSKANAFPTKAVDVIDVSGQVKSELVDILKQVAEADIVLATAHLSVSEIKKVFDAALKAGVRKFVVTHPEIVELQMSIVDQRELADRGAMFERCICSITLNPPDGATTKLIADQIRAVGFSSTVMATDYGQSVSPLPVQGMLYYVEEMLKYGFNSQEIEIMVKTNPERLLGLRTF
jgi:hypothetical protein